MLQNWIVSVGPSSNELEAQCERDRCHHSETENIPKTEFGDDDEDDFEHLSAEAAGDAETSDRSTADLIADGWVDLLGSGDIFKKACNN